MGSPISVDPLHPTLADAGNDASVETTGEFYENSSVETASSVQDRSDL